MEHLAEEEPPDARLRVHVRDARVVAVEIVARAEVVVAPLAGALPVDLGPVVAVRVRRLVDERAEAEARISWASG